MSLPTNKRGAEKKEGGNSRGGWGEFYNEELHNLYSSPNIIRAIKSKRMRWARHVARLGEMIN
jgi:hypothetical protein